MSDKPLRATILAEAADLITGEREADYGTPYSNFSDIAAFWNVYLTCIVGDRSLRAEDVAEMMSLLKKARKKPGYKYDTCADDLGYTAIAAECRALYEEQRDRIAGNDYIDDYLKTREVFK